MSTPFKMRGFSGFGNSPMKQDKKMTKTVEKIARKVEQGEKPKDKNMAMMQSSKTGPTKKEIASIKLHNLNLKDYGKEYSSSYYDERKANNAKILKKYPNYNWDK